MNIVRLQKKEEPSKLSEDVIVNEQMRSWAKKRGVAHLQERYEHFVDYLANREGKPYRDLQAAFRNACRQDWAKLGFPKFQAEPETCSKCGGSIARGHVMSQSGKLCNQCWVNR